MTMTVKEYRKALRAAAELHPEGCQCSTCKPGEEITRKTKPKGKRKNAGEMPPR